jgi:hypothetical protein
MKGIFNKKVLGEQPRTQMPSVFWADIFRGVSFFSIRRRVRARVKPPRPLSNQQSPANQSKMTRGTGGRTGICFGFFSISSVRKSGRRDVLVSLQ